MTHQELTHWADARKTSIEIAEAIHELYENPDEVWEDPTVEQFENVSNLAWRSTNEDVLHWGLELIKRVDTP